MAEPQTVYLEHMVKKHPDTAIRAKQLAAILVVPVITGVFVFVQQLTVFSPMAFLFSLWWAFRFVSRQSFEFEYILTGGELDVDKIIAQRARKHVITVDCKEFEQLAPLCEQWRERYPRDHYTILDVSSSAEAPGRYAAVFRHGGKQTVLIFEPNTRMLEMFQTLIPRKIQTK